MGSESEERRARMEERIRALHARRRRPEFVGRLAEIIGARVNLDDFLSPEATERLKVECAPRLAAQNVQRRTWSSDLRDEMVQILAVLREQMSEVSAYLLHTEDYLLGAVLVPIAPMIRWAEEDFEPWVDDLWLVADKGKSGMRLAWDHLPDRDEYELVTWGAFRSTRSD